MFEHVKGEVVEAAETPDRGGEQPGDFDLRVFDEQQGRGKDSNEEKQNAFELNPNGVGKILHSSEQGGAET